MVIGRTVTAQERGHIRHKHSQSPSLNLRLKHRLQFNGTLHQTCQCKPSSSMSVLHQLHKQVLAQPKLQLTSWNKPWLIRRQDRNTSCTQIGHLMPFCLQKQ